MPFSAEQPTCDMSSCWQRMYSVGFVQFGAAWARTDLLHFPCFAEQYVFGPVGRRAGRRRRQL